MDVYRIGVSLAMTSNVPTFLTTLSSQLTGVHAQIDGLQGKLNRLSLAIGGGLAAATGIGLLTMFDKVARHGDELLDQQNKLIRAGRTHQEVAELTAKAYQDITKAVPTATGADVLRVANQLSVVTGSFESAIAGATQSLKIEALLANATGKSAEGSGHSLWRAIEMKGLSGGSPEARAVGGRLLETFFQDIAASGGKLTAGDFQSMAKRGGAAWAAATPEFLAGPMAVLGADMGGDAAGTTMATFRQLLTGAATLSKQQYAALNSIGMIDPSKVTTDLGGRLNMGPGAIVGGMQYSGDYYNWIQKVLLPHMETAGVHEGPERDDLLAKIGRNRNTQRMLTMFSEPEFVAQITKDIGIFRHSMGIDKAYDEYTQNDPKGVRSAFDKQFASMLQSICAPMMQAALPVMKTVTQWFSDVGAFANAHPDAFKRIGEGIAAAGLALTAAGGAALLVALGPAGLIVGAISAIGVLVAFNWDTLRSGLTSVTAGLGKFVDAIVGVVKGIESALAGIASHLGSGTAAPGNPLFGGTSYEGGGIAGLIHKASLGGALPGSFRPGNDNFSGTGVGHVASQAERAAYIRERARAYGIDPNVALGAAKSEGFGRFTGDYGTSFGDFQLHYGGSGIRGMNSGGEGDLFTRATGLSAKDPRNWRAADDWALKRARQNGWGAWHGSARVGIAPHQGIGTAPASETPHSKASGQWVENHHHIYIGGTKVAHEVSRQMASAARYPTEIGGMDSYGSWRPPGTTLTDAA